jgi:hypothetical protein
VQWANTSVRARLSDCEIGWSFRQKENDYARSRALKRQGCYILPIFPCLMYRLLGSNLNFGELNMAQATSNVSEQLLPSQADQKLPDTTADKVAAGMDYKALGKADAKEIQLSMVGAESFKRQRITERAEKLAGLPAGEQWLEGYADYYSTDKNNGTRKTRLSEARTIFTAWHFAGNGKTIEENREVIRNFKGGFNEWVEAARDMRGKRGSGRPQGATQQNVTPKQLETVEKAIPMMSSAQILEMSNKATAQLSKTVDGEIAIVRKMVNNDLMLLQQAKDKAIAKAAKDAYTAFSRILQEYEKEELAKRAASEAKSAEFNKGVQEAAEKQQAAAAAAK